MYEYSHISLHEEALVDCLFPPICEGCGRPKDRVCLYTAQCTSCCAEAINDSSIFSRIKVVVDNEHY